MSGAELFIEQLRQLGTSELTLLRVAANQPMGGNLPAFDLFTSMWWPLRNSTPRVPAREASWIVCKLYPWNMRSESALSLAAAMSKGLCSDDARRARAIRMLDTILVSELSLVEPFVRDVLRELARREIAVNYVSLLDDLSRWDSKREKISRSWAEQLLGYREEG